MKGELPRLARRSSRDFISQRRPADVEGARLFDEAVAAVVADSVYTYELLRRPSISARSLVERASRQAADPLARRVGDYGSVGGVLAFARAGGVMRCTGELPAGVRFADVLGAAFDVGKRRGISREVDEMLALGGTKA